MSSSRLLLNLVQWDYFTIYENTRIILFSQHVSKVLGMQSLFSDALMRPPPPFLFFVRETSETELTPQEKAN